VGDKWTLLIVRDLAAGPRRFVELQRVLPGISTEQLRSRLNRMVADGMLTRTRYREVPPRVDYSLTERARELMPILGELARWGYSWAWSSPRNSENVDLGAIFRLVGGLVHPNGTNGTVEFSIEDGENSTCYSFTVGGGEVRVRECNAERADSRVAGDREAWIKAFSPARDNSALRITGNTQLAEMLLAGLRGQDREHAVSTIRAA
jgi:DNA-binding HxlR family transcriptional regulator